MLPAVVICGRRASVSSTARKTGKNPVPLCASVSELNSIGDDECGAGKWSRSSSSTSVLSLPFDASLALANAPLSMLFDADRFPREMIIIPLAASRQQPGHYR